MPTESMTTPVHTVWSQSSRWQSEQTLGPCLIVCTDNQRVHHTFTGTRPLPPSKFTRWTFLERTTPPDVGRSSRESQSNPEYPMKSRIFPIYPACYTFTESQPDSRSETASRKDSTSRPMWPSSTRGAFGHCREPCFVHRFGPTAVRGTFVAGPLLRLLSIPRPLTMFEVSCRSCLLCVAGWLCASMATCGVGRDGEGFWRGGHHGQRERSGFS